MHYRRAFCSSLLLSTCSIYRRSVFALLSCACALRIANLAQTGHEPPVWWGNTVVGSTLDNTNKAVKIKLGDGETLGPPAGSW